MDMDVQMPKFEPSWVQLWDSAEAQKYVADGLCEKIETVETIGIHPYWVRNIVVGAMERLREDLGRWSKRFQGYLIGFHRPYQLPVSGTQASFPNPLIYYQFKIIRYIYRPVVGQKLQGVITSIGASAGTCLVFQTFVATVYPSSYDEFPNWSVGEELTFLVESINPLRKGVVLRGTSISGTRKTKAKPKKNKHIRLDQDELMETDSIISETNLMMEQEAELEETPKKKRKKSKPTNID